MDESPEMYMLKNLLSDIEKSIEEACERAAALAIEPSKLELSDGKLVINDLLLAKSNVLLAMIILKNATKAS